MRRIHIYKHTTSLSLNIMGLEISALIVLFSQYSRGGKSREETENRMMKTHTVQTHRFAQPEYYITRNINIHLFFFALSRRQIKRKQTKQTSIKDNVANPCSFKDSHKKTKEKKSCFKIKSSSRCVLILPLLTACKSQEGGNNIKTVKRMTDCRYWLALA